MADMVARPLMAELDAEREVVLEEVALYEDSPSELIHDYLAETVFWEHPLGRQIIGTAETLQGLDEPVISAYHRRALREPVDRRSRRPATCATSASSSSPGATSAPAPPSRRRPSRACAQPQGPPRRLLHAQGHRAVPRLPGRAGHGARRPAALRPVGARHRPRRLVELAPVPGDPREARPRLLGLLVHLALRRHRPGGHLVRLAARGPGRGHGALHHRAASTSPTRSPTKRSSAPRSRSRDRSCSAWRAPRRA